MPELSWLTMLKSFMPGRMSVIAHPTSLTTLAHIDDLLNVLFLLSSCE